MRCFLRFTGVLLFFLTLSPTLFLDPALAQTPEEININDLSRIRVDDLSDEQVRQFVSRAEESGMTMSQLETAALSRGMSYAEIVKLRTRIRELDRGSEGNETVSREGQLRKPVESDLDRRQDFFEIITREETGDPGVILQEEKTEDAPEELQIFGSALFSQENLSFAPNLNIPTPKNYILGPGDEVIVEVYGASQESYSLLINPDGWVRISNIGPVLLSGLTIEQAGERLKNRLSGIYSGIGGNSPNTFMEVALGDLRSISINIAGEVNLPGSYTLPSFSTVFNALYLAGGPNEQGSYRSVQVVRDNELIAKIDLYDYLMKGIAKDNLRLQDQDIVFVEPYTHRVTMEGEVKRPALYEMVEGESLEDLIRFAGGFTGEAFTGRITLTRNTPEQKKIVDVPYGSFEETHIQNGDKVLVGKILSRFENRVTIKGAVYREGDYEFTVGMTLTDLIMKANGLRKDAYLAQASLYRQQENLKTQVIPVDLEEMITGPATLPLQSEDLIFVSSIFDLEEEFKVKISGEVQEQGDFPWYKGMNLGELLRMAGGLKESASLARLEIARRVKKREATEKLGTMAEVFTFALPENMSLSSEAMSFELEPFDIVFIRRSPGYEVQHLITMDGEISFPGQYSLTNNKERISDLISRAGGLTSEAYPPGATLYRKTGESSPEIRETIIRQLQATSEDTLQLMDEEMNEEQAIGIDLPFILSNPGTPADLFLKDGDRLVIPTEIQTVRVSGALLYPVTVKYQDNKGLYHYVANAGGFADNAHKKKTYVLYANGSVDRTRSFLGIRDYPAIQPGAEIIVPQKPEKERVGPQQAIATSSAIASLALVLVTLIGAL